MELAPEKIITLEQEQLMIEKEIYEGLKLAIDEFEKKPFKQPKRGFFSWLFPERINKQFVTAIEIKSNQSPSVLKKITEDSILVTDDDVINFTRYFNDITHKYILSDEPITWTAYKSNAGVLYNLRSYILVQKTFQHSFFISLTVHSDKVPIKCESFCLP